METKKRVVVVGGGLGGLSAAMCMRAAGHEVTVLEKNERVGGKLNIRQGLGYTFDTGPSILTMPWVLEQLFARTGRSLHHYVTLTRVEPQWHTVFEDGTHVDVVGDLPTMIKNIQDVHEADAAHFMAYVATCQKMYDLSMKSIYKEHISGVSDMREHHSFRELMAMEPLKTVDQVTARYVRDPRLRQLWNFFQMYIGSSPYDAPAVLSQLVYVQLGLGIYFVQGGMYRIAEAMLRVLDELGVEVRTNAPVASIDIKNGAATGVTLANGGSIAADCVLCNLEFIPAHETLLKGNARAEVEIKQAHNFSPTVSGHVLLLGINREYPQFAHHNFFFSRDAAREFDDMFVQQKVTDDPTVYVGISCKSDRTQAPQGKENWFVLTHVPPLQRGASWEQHRERYRNLVLEKLERMGAADLRAHIEWKDEFIPDDIQSLYGATQGSIYGVVSNRKRNGGFKLPTKCAWAEGLYFVGGSTHPGGGVPMVTLSGQLASDVVLRDLQRVPT
ncbi:MAG: phytoene desaturase [Paenibacillaceae bacterium]|nr:phytoene desaturase [Paenibacillaceae bacterium]